MTGTAGGLAPWPPTETGAGQLPPSPGAPEGFPGSLSLPPGSGPALPPTPAARAPSAPSPTDPSPLPPRNTPSTSGGLVRRVPGARLAPPLRVPPQGPRQGNDGPLAGGRAPGGDGSAAPGGSGNEGPWGAWGRQAPGSPRAHDSREHVRSMLSRFQASQRAARAVTRGGSEAQADEPEDAYETGPEPDEDEDMDQPGGTSQPGWLSRFEASQQAGRAVAGAPASEFATGAAVSTGETGGPPEDHLASDYGSSEDGGSPGRATGSAVSDQDGQGHTALQQHEEQGGDQDG